MFRSVLSKVGRVVVRSQMQRHVVQKPRIVPLASIAARYSSSTPVPQTEEEIAAMEKSHDDAWIAFFDKIDNVEYDYIDFKIGFNDMMHNDMVPEPAIVQAALYACRRLNNFALAIRILELVRIKCNTRQDIYEYIIQELQPTLDDLGIKTPEELDIAVAKETGYDREYHTRFDHSLPSS